MEGRCFKSYSQQSGFPVGPLNKTPNPRVTQGLSEPASNKSLCHMTIIQKEYKFHITCSLNHVIIFWNVSEKVFKNVQGFFLLMIKDILECVILQGFEEPKQFKIDNTIKGV